jgi:hypothetical protein
MHVSEKGFFMLKPKMRWHHVNDVLYSLGCRGLFFIGGIKWDLEEIK